jgi:putative heme-binding domain-containing protein
MNLSQDQVQMVTSVVSSSSTDRAVLQVVGEAVTAPDTPNGTRITLLRAIGQSPLNPFPEDWLSAVAGSLAHPDADVCLASIAVVRDRGIRRFDSRLAEIGRKSDVAVEARIAALECLAGRLAAIDQSSFEFLRSQMTDATEPLVRLSGARALAASTLTIDQQIGLATLTEHAGPLVFRLLLPLFAKGTDLRVGTAVVAALARAPATDVLSPAELDQTLQNYPPVVRAQAVDLRRRLAARLAARSAELTQLGSEIDRLPGDPDAGQELFLSPKVGCYGCHRAVGRGGVVGPDLSHIGKMRSRTELLEAIVLPGRTIAPEYRAYQVALRDGRIVAGLIARDTPDAIVMRTTDLAEVRIPRASIETVNPSMSSTMPEGFERTLSRQELRDLIEFLARQQ